MFVVCTGQVVAHLKASGTAIIGTAAGRNAQRRPYQLSRRWPDYAGKRSTIYQIKPLLSPLALAIGSNVIQLPFGSNALVGAQLTRRARG